MASSTRAVVGSRITSYNVCYTKLLRIAERCIVAGVGEGHDEIGVDLRFPGQNLTHPFSCQINRGAEDFRVGTSEIDLLENAEMGRLLGPGEDRAHFPVLEDQHFAGFDIADIFGVHQVKSAGLGGDDSYNFV